MQKILLAVDAFPINLSTLNFACYVAKLTQSALTGIFLQNIQGEPSPSLKSVYGSTYVETITTSAIQGNKTRMAQCEENIRLFESVCAGKAVKAYVHRDPADAEWELVSETRFADLLIIDAKLSTRNGGEVLPDFTKEVLSKSECPILVAPLNFTDIDDIVFAYDGSESAAFAIKQFTYQFPQLTDKKLTIVQVDAHEDMPVIQKDKISELLRIHYSSIGYHHLQGKASDELFGYLLGRKNCIVVMGAYGRRALPAYFRHSTADLLIKTINLPLFIAHH